MHGVLQSIDVSPGDRVSKGDCLAVLEAMKMQHEIVAELDGAVTSIYAAVGTQIAAGGPILEIAPQGAPDSDAVSD